MADAQHDTKSGGVEVREHEITGSAEAAAFSALLLVAAGSDRYQKLIASSSASRLSRLVEAVPPLPAYDHFRQHKGSTGRSATKATESPVRIPEDQQGLFVGAATWGYMRNIILKLAGQKATEQPYLSTSQVGSIARKLAKVFRGGNIDNIGKHVQQTDSQRPRDHMDRLLPISLLHAAALSMSYRAASEQPEVDDPLTIATTLADAPLREACKRIRDGERPMIDNTDPIAALETGALSALYQAYHLPQDQVFFYEAIATLEPLVRKDRGSEDATPSLRSVFDLAREFIGYGFTSSVDVEAAQPIVAAKLNETRKLASLHHTEYVKRVERLYGKLGMSFFARYLVDAIANGRMTYSETSDVANCVTNHPLDHRFNMIRVRQEAEAEKAAKKAEEKAREEARLRDLGWLSVQLRLNPENEVDVEFLPSASGARTIERHAETARQRDARERIAKIEEHRLLTLIRLQEIYPGSVVRFRTLKNKKSDNNIPKQRLASDDAEIVDPMKVDGYLVLVLPDGRAVGESLQPGNATVIFRPETWQGSNPPITFEDAFAFDKEHVKDYATVRIQHPDKRDLAADYSGTVESYVLLILEDLERPLQSGETLPDLERMRNLRRALGSKASSTAR